MINLVLYGASYPDTIKIINKINEKNNAINLIGYLDDLKFEIENTFLGYPIIGNINYLTKINKDYLFFNNVFSNTRNRKKVTNCLKAHSAKLVSLIHPSIDISFSKIGNNVCVMEGVKIGCNSMIDDDVCIRYNSIINHDNIIGKNVFIGPGATLCGRVHIKEGAYIGAGSTIIENITVGRYSTIGAGAVVINNVNDNDTVVGVPAKSIKAI